MNDKELIEKLNNKRRWNNLGVSDGVQDKVKENVSTMFDKEIKKIPIKIVDNSKVEKIKEEFDKCCGNCDDCECDCEFNNDGFRKSPKEKPCKKTDDEILIERLNRLNDIRKRQDSHYVKCGTNSAISVGKSNPNERKDVTHILSNNNYNEYDSDYVNEKFFKNFEEVVKNFDVNKFKNLKNFQSFKDKFEELRNSDFQKKLTELFKKIDFKKFSDLFSEVSRFLCTPEGQEYLDLIGYNRERINTLPGVTLDVIKKKEPLTEEQLNENLQGISPVFDKCLEVDDSVKKVGKYNKDYKDDKYRIFNFDRSKEIMHKMENLDKGLPLEYKEKTTYDILKEIYENEGDVSTAYTLDEVLAKIKKGIEDRQDKKKQKALEVWNFIFDTVDKMKDTMCEIANNNNGDITPNDLETIFNKYIGVWTLLYDEI